MIVREVFRDGKLTIPAEMGEPAAHQMQGPPLQQLGELCGRICYDSLGAPKSRTSEEYHAHIRESSHKSVYEHCVFTVALPRWFAPVEEFLNRPSLWVDVFEQSYRVTLNLRHVMEWGGGPLARDIQSIAHTLAPLVAGRLLPARRVTLVPPRSDRERWVSLYIGGVSRNLTHELVRHGDWTAISQRSTRYCDESSSPIAWHPALPATPAIERHADAAQKLYSDIVDNLTREGIDRKTARGAARGVLPSALSTELIFSASLAQWKHICALRNHPDADAEIREMARRVSTIVLG